MYTLINYYGLRMTSDRPDLSPERAPNRDNTATFGQKVISGHKSQSIVCPFHPVSPKRLIAEKSRKEKK
jgi:hypothetical protein